MAEPSGLERSRAVSISRRRGKSPVATGHRYVSNPGSGTAETPGDANGVGERVCVLIPRPFQELFGGDDSSFGSDQDFKHGELLAGGRDVAAVAVDLSPEWIKSQAGDLSHGGRCWARRRSSARRRSTS